MLNQMYEKLSIQKTIYILSCFQTVAMLQKVKEENENEKVNDVYVSNSDFDISYGWM